MEYRTSNIERRTQNVEHRSKNAPCSMFYEQCSSGFTMLFAVLISGVLMAIGISIFNISLKELRLSSTARDSNLAFYAADTGRECAIYWDMVATSKLNSTGELFGFATSTESAGQTISDIEQFACGSKIIAGTPFVSKLTDSATTNFTVQLGDDEDFTYCADVSIQKNKNYTEGTSDTNIVSQGHNTCNMEDSVIVERGTEANYSD